MRRTVALLVSASVVFGAANPAFSAEPTVVPVTVTPSTDLVDGSIVGIDADLTGDIGFVYQCRDVDLADAIAGAGCASIPVLGELLPVESSPVDRWIGSLAEPGWHDCAVVDCSLIAVGFDILGNPFPLALNSYGVASIEFEPTDQVIAPVPAAAGQTDVYASFFDVPAGSAAFAMRCGWLATGLVCGDLGTVVFDFDGSFVGQVPAGPTFSDGVSSVDCTVVTCGIAVVVLAPGPVVFAGTGVVDPNY